MVMVEERFWLIRITPQHDTSAIKMALLLAKCGSIAEGNAP